jgi:RNA polymerase sigma-70 factor (ECF subfamily)
MFDYSGMLRGCARRDRAALKTLYDQEAGRMISVAQRIVRRRELAEEVVQDTFVQIWRKADRFNEELGSWQAWIYTILRNRALNLIRDGAREDLIDAETLDQTRDEDANIDDAFQRLSEDSALRRCLEALEVEKRKSLLLSYVAGYSHGEIAAMLRVPVGTAKSWVRRGLLAIRDCMA